MSQIAFLFPGQGAQHIGMASPLVDDYPVAKELFEHSSQVLGYNLIEVCNHGPADKLDSTVISQPALFVSSIAALEIVKAKHPELISKCSMSAGLSLGEYTALVFAGAMSFEDGLKVVKRRGEAMQAAADATASAMASILMLPIDQVEKVCQEASSKGEVRIANLLCPGNTVVSGVTAAVDEAVKLAEAAGGKTVRLAVAGAFHTSIMKPADEALAEVLSTVSIQAPRIPVYSNVDAKPHTDPEEIRQILVQQVLKPVQWETSIRNMMNDGMSEAWEIGPGRVLKGLFKRIDRKFPCHSLHDGE